jgi:four helix bundle protein
MAGFEELVVWQRSSQLCITLYRELDGSRQWSYRDQITRAALSVPSNIAEGYERGSRKEYIQYFRIAKGSCGELRTQLHVGSVAGLLGKEMAAGLLAEATELSKMLGAMISRLLRDSTR